MKRIAIGAVVVGLIAPAQASALTRDFAGHVDPSGTIQFTFKQSRHGKKVVDLKFKHVPITCNGHDLTTSGKVNRFAFKVKHRKFGATLNNGAGAFLKIDGTFTHHYRNAHGTIRVHGDNVPVDQGGDRNNCDTGTDDWHAQKV